MSCNSQYVTTVSNGFTNHPPSRANNNSDVICLNNVVGDACLSNDTTRTAADLLLNGSEVLSNNPDDNLLVQESLSNYIFPDIHTRSTMSAVNVSGLVDASTLPDNAELVLVDNANIFMDVNKTLKCIRGDHSLTISGGNILTLDNANGYAIDVTSVTISAPLVVSSSYVAIGAQSGLTINNTVRATSTNTCIGTVEGTITINANVTANTTSSAAIFNRSGDIIINSGMLNVTGGNSGNWAYGIAALGNISSKTGTTINVRGGTAIYSEKGYIHLSGDVYATAKGNQGYGLYAKVGDISVATVTVPSSYIAIGAQTGLTINNTVNATSTNTCMGTVDGTITINANVTANTTSSAGILNRGGDIIINSGTVSVIGGNSGDWAYGIAALGNVSSKTGTTINVTGGTAIYSEKGNIHLSGDAYATAKGKDGYGLYAKVGDISVATVTVPSSYIAIGAQTGLIINNTVNATSTNTCMGTVEGTITINANVTANTTSSAGILNRGGDIIINSGTVSVTGGNSGDWAYGIAALGNVSSKTGTTINVTGGTAIYSEKGNIHLSGDAYATAKGKNGYGLYAKVGDISVATVTVPSSYVAIGAQTGLTINNTVNATSTNTCIGTVEGTITINANVTANTTSSAGILNRGGDIIINSGTVNVTGGNSGDWAYGIAALGNIKIKSGKVVAKGGSKGIFAQDGNITITSPLQIMSPVDGRISADGHTVVDGNNVVQTRVVIMTPPISGTVALSSIPTPGETVGISLSANVSLSEISCRWQISDDKDIWIDIESATDKVYVPLESELGKYLRVRVEATELSGYLYTPSRQVTKRLCTDVPVAPILTNINDKVHLSNAKTTQEYIIFNYSKEASSLTENDWNNAVTPDSEIGFFEMNSTNNANHTVFTRIKETTSTWASERVAEGRIYIGTSIYLQDIELNISKTVGFFQNICNELNCKVGDVIRCDAMPVPSNATNWYGISGSNWTVDYHNTGSPYGEFYEDEDCTIPISQSTNYETVYLKTLAEKNYLEVRILLYNSSIGYKTRAMQFNVSYDGTFPPLDYISGCSMTIAAGEKMTNLDVGRRPLSASVYGLTTVVSGEGTAPTVTFNIYEKITVNATNATPGVYTYTPIQNGNPLTTSEFTITVTDGKYPVEDINLLQTEMVADPGETVELVPQLLPVNSETAVSWGSSDYSIATVSDGMVHISPNAEIGAEVIITATADASRGEEINSSCVITVSGEEYDLYVASTRVTSRNRDDILGDGTVSFDGLNTLTIKGDVNMNTPVALVENIGVDDLVINIEENSTITQDVGVEHTIFDLKKDTKISGGAQLIINANTVGVYVDNDAALTLDSANIVIHGQFPMTGDIGGGESLNIKNSRLEIHALGYAAIDDFGGGITLIDCIITEPEGAEVSDITIVDVNGNYVRNLLIVPYVEKVEPSLEFEYSKVEAVLGDEFVPPILWNPFNLQVTYYSSDMNVAYVNDYSGEVIILSEGTTTITASYMGDYYTLPGSASYELTVIKPDIIFVGDGDWYALTNWEDEEMPLETDNVLIKGNAYIYDNVWINSITIDEGASLTLYSGKLTVMEGIVNNDVDALIIYDGTQVYQNNDNVYATFVMNIANPLTWSEDHQGGWQFITSPVKNAMVADFDPLTSDYDLYKYDGDQNLEWVNYKNHTNDFEATFQQGRAYIASYETEDVAEFEGVMNHETSFVFDDIDSYDYNNDYANYYLVGNPFMFDIEWDNMTRENVYDGLARLNVDGTYDYDVNAEIKVGDGFFIMTTDENPSLSYGMRKSRSEKYESINVIASNSEGSDNVVIHLAGNEKGGFVKLENINDKVANLYVKNDNVPYGIFSYDKDIDEVPLYFDSRQMGNYNISVVTDGDFEHVTLVDRFTGVETNILKEGYDFTSLSNDYPDRFVLRIGKVQQSDNTHFAYINNGELVISDIYGDADIKIFDVMGRCVFNGECNNTECTVSTGGYPSGVYVIMKVDDNGINVQKIIL